MGKSDKKKKKLRFNPPPLTMPSDFQSEVKPDDTVATLEDDGHYHVDITKIDTAPVFTSPTPNSEDGAFFFAVRPSDMSHIMKSETDYRRDDDDDTPTQRTPQQEKNWKTKCRVMRMYNDALASIKIGTTYEQALTMDTIDVRMATEKLARDNESLEQFEKFLSSEDAFYAYIPCFTKGIILLNEHVYMMWKLLDIDVEKTSYDVQLHVFSTHDNDPNTWWLNLTMKFTVNVTNFDEPDEPLRALITAKVKDICQTDQLTRALNLNAVGFTKQDQDFWKNTVRRFTDRFIKELVDTYRFQFIDTAKAFLRSITAANYFMSLTPARIPAEHRKNAKKSNTAAKSKPKETPERVLRIIDCMPIISSTMPRCPTRKTVAQYRVASWQTRGHVRRYKSGKTVYVKPSVHHRKNMKPADDSRPQQIIYIRDNSDITEENG